MPAIRRKTASRRTLFDRLSRLTFEDACRMLGAAGTKHLAEGGKIHIDAPSQVRLTADRFELRLPAMGDGDVRVVIRPHAGRRGGLVLECAPRRNRHLYMGAALAFILEEKQYLGLAAAPLMDRPFELLSEKELVERALTERAVRASEEPMDVVPAAARTPWTDYAVTNRLSGKTYRVALRGLERGRSYCTCADFRANTLGVCKHVLKVQDDVRLRFPPKTLQRPYRQNEYAVAVDYVGVPAPRLLVPEGVSGKRAREAGRLAGRDLASPEDVRRLFDFLARAQAEGAPVRIYPDAEDWLDRFLHRERLFRLVTEIRRDPAAHPLRKSLLKTELLPYQLDGVAFAAGAGRAILADDMGLGKTIQGIGVAEFLRREAGIGRVLIVCPASLKAQWAREIERFSALESRRIAGSAAQRLAQYAEPCFFTICNYEQVLRDLPAIERVTWDLILLDEGQRIKNWEAKTSRLVKSLRSRFALVLSGTPLENRLDDLYSVVEFIDGQRLGPAFRFFHAHRIVDENGRVTGYKNLDRIREKLKPILLRRTRALLRDQLPPRSTEIVRIVPTDEQKRIHDGSMQVVSMLLRKAWFTEMDLLRLRQALLVCRLAANGTVLVDKEGPSFSSKLDRLAELLEELRDEEDRKFILFSEWTGMLNLIEPILGRLGVGFVRLDGKVPQRKRQEVVDRFQRDPGCPAILLTNAGSTGLNLQAANTVINVDLPWNPAVLEQRIGRAHRMGQKRLVQVYLLVTEETIEESLLNTLSAKKELALAALDTSSDLREVRIESNVEEMRRRLEVLLGAKPEAPHDASESIRVDDAVAAKKEQVANAAGQVLSAAFRFAETLLPPADGRTEEAAGTYARQFRDQLDRCVEIGSDGRPRLTVSLDGADSLDQFARLFARLVQLPQD